MHTLISSPIQKNTYKGRFDYLIQHLAFANGLLFFSIHIIQNRHKEAALWRTPKAFYTLQSLRGKESPKKPSNMEAPSFTNWSTTWLAHLDLQ